MGLLENTRTEPVRRLSLRQPATVERDATVADAVRAMRDARLGCVVVVDADNRPVGMFTEAMLRTLLVRSSAVVDEAITAHMAEQFPCVLASDPIELVLDAMEAKNVRFVPVVDDEGRLMGLTGQKGMMEYVAEHFPRLVLGQRVGTHPFPAQREGG
jgi:CBS domain-containing protein